MVTLRYVTRADWGFWLQLDRHLTKKVFLEKCRKQTAFVLWAGGIDVGVLRYNLFWDQTPFLNLIYFAEGYRSVGLGRQALASWEEKMIGLGHQLGYGFHPSGWNGSTFYRKLGYKDCGSLCLANQALEIIMIKILPLSSWSLRCLRRRVLLFKTRTKTGI